MQHPLMILNGVTIVDPNAATVKVLGGDAVLQVDASMLRGPNARDPYHVELQYLALLNELVEKADQSPRADRTGVGTYSVFGRQMRFNLEEGFPLLTTKKLWQKGIFGELAWMLRGETDNEWLTERGIHIWDEWANENGQLGPIYGRQWRSWEGHEGHIDQIANAIDQIANNPGSRRIIVNAWNVADLPFMQLSPCHTMFQFYVDDGKLDCQLYQRSADIFLGVPYNIASYAALTHLIAEETGLAPGTFIHTFGDLHLYSNHVEQARLQLTRTPKPLGRLVIKDTANIFELEPSDLAVEGYEAHPAIEAEVAV